VIVCAIPVHHRVSLTMPSCAKTHVFTGLF
jgi:hypothetical protein